MLSSDGVGELRECLRDPVPQIEVGAKLVVAAVEILHEGVSCTDYPRGAQPLETAHRPQASVICLNQIVRARAGGWGALSVLTSVRDGPCSSAWMKNRRIAA